MLVFPVAGHGSSKPLEHMLKHLVMAFCRAGKLTIYLSVNEVFLIFSMVKATILIY